MEKIKIGKYSKEIQFVNIKMYITFRIRSLWNNVQLKWRVIFWYKTFTVSIPLLCLLVRKLWASSHLRKFLGFMIDSQRAFV